MNKEELLTLFSDILKEKDILKAKGFTEENHKPHQFMVGAKHQVAATEENEGVLTEEILARIPCEHIACDAPYEEHTSDKTLIIQLTRNAYEADVYEELKKIKLLMLENQVKALAFADTDEKFAFLRGESPEDSVD